MVVMAATALVTGATGFVGAALVRRLAADGVAVRVLVRPSSDTAAVEGSTVAVVRGDLTDPGVAARAVSGADVVYHLAARNDLGAPDAAEMRRANVEITRVVLTAAARAGAVAVHCSSIAALGPTPGAGLAGEAHWSESVVPVEYARSKREAHLVARSLAAGGARVRIASPGGVYGAGDHSPLVDMMARVVNGVPLGYVPRNRQSFVHVDDCADALVRVGGSGVDGREYVVVADAVTFREFWTMLAHVAGRRRPLFVPAWMVQAGAHAAPLLSAISGLDAAYVHDAAAMIRWDSAYSGRRLRDELGWSPRSLADGLGDVVTWLRDRQRGGD